MLLAQSEKCPLHDRFEPVVSPGETGIPPICLGIFGLPESLDTRREFSGKKKP
jgi:hypothetical protein